MEYTKQEAEERAEEIYHTKWNFISSPTGLSLHVYKKGFLNALEMVGMLADIHTEKEEKE